MELFNKPVVSSIGSYLLTRNETIAVAESVTCGLLQAAIGTANDARHFYQGGITAYNLAQKYRHLCVEPVHAMKVNCVSQEVAAEMAINVCKGHRHYRLCHTGSRIGEFSFCFFCNSKWRQYIGCRKN